MISFNCAHCNKYYEFKLLPIPDGGAKFQCDECSGTCILIKQETGDVICVQDESQDDIEQSSTQAFFDTYDCSDDMSPQDLEARLQGVYAELPYNIDFMIGITEGPEQGTTFPLKEPKVMIGKTGCSINLQDSNISREHCQIEIYGNQYVVIRDLKSTWGTFRNGFPVTLAHLRPGDIIQMGKTKFIFIQNMKDAKE